MKGGVGSVPGVLHGKRRGLVVDPVWWYVYILSLRLPYGKSKYFGLTNILYTGITQDLGRRMGDYRYRRGNGYINRLWWGALRRLVHVERFYGTEKEARVLEKKIKRMSQDRKRARLNSDLNVLTRVFPGKCFILRDGNGEELVRIR